MKTSTKNSVKIIYKIAKLSWAIAIFSISCGTVTIDNRKGNGTDSTSSSTTPIITDVPPLHQYNCTKPGKKVYINSAGTYLDGGSYVDSNSGEKIMPGDTIVLKSSISRTYFTVQNLHGDTNCPVTITNEGGQVKLVNGFNFSDTTYLIVDGSGDTNTQYGFYISNYPADGDNPAIDINHRSSVIEVKYVEMFQKDYGVVAKQDPLCDEQYNYPNWTFDNIFIHQNYIHNMNQEGMYLGNTAPNGIGRSITCCGKNSCNNGDPGYEVRSPIPARLSNIQIVGNIIDHTARAGIQLSAAASGTNQVYQNKVSDTGWEHNQDQGRGITLGGVSHADICGNTVTHTWNSGIWSNGSGLTRIENNHIDHCGIDPNGAGYAYSSCIELTTAVTLPAQYESQYTIQNNDIAGPSKDVDFKAVHGAGVWSNDNIFTDDIVDKYIESGIKFSASASKEVSPCDGINAIP